MDDRQKEKTVARLTSGLTRIKLDDTPVYISHPRLVDSLEAQEIYEECLIDAELSEPLLRNKRDRRCSL